MGDDRDKPRPKRRLRKSVLHIIIFLVLGVIVNVAIAWSCALLSPAGEWWDLSYAETPPDAVMAKVPLEWNVGAANLDSSDPEAELFRAQSFGRASYLLYVMTEWIDHRSWRVPDYRLHVERAGWPMHSMECTSIDDLRGEDYAERTRPPQNWSGGWLAPPGASTLSAEHSRDYRYRHPLPLRPLAIGFAVNSIAFACALWLFVRGFRRFRLHRARVAAARQNSGVPAKSKTVRNVMRASLWLLIGAIFSVVLALACSLWSPLGRGWDLHVNEKLPPDLQALIPPAWLETPSPPHASVSEHLERRMSFGFTFEHVAIHVLVPGVLKGGPDHATQVYSAGFPFRMLECHVLIPDPTMSGEPLTSQWMNGGPAPDALKPRRIDAIGASTDAPALPWRVRPIAFACNAFFWAVAIYLIAHMPAWIIRSRRRRFGLCPACGYPIGNSQRCSECGTPFSSNPLPPPVESAPSK